MPAHRRPARVRILLLSIADPGDYSSGGNQRSNHLRDALLDIADVDTVAFTREGASFVQADWGPERVVRINTSPSDGRRERIGQRRAARRIIAAAESAHPYDFIVARYFRTAVLVPRRAHHKLVVDGDDLRQSGAGQPLARRLFLRIRAAAIRAMARRLFHLWLVDPRDRVAVPGTRTSMLPNTASRLPAAEATPAKTGRRILMVGTYPYPPNEQGLVWFARVILPRIVELFPDVEFHAVGQYYKRELEVLGPAVRMRGFVDDLAGEYAQADVVICPITSGSGTQIKVVEALMSGRPTLVSDFSYQGFADVLAPDKHLLVARGEQEWVRHLTAVLDDPGCFAAMADRARTTAERAYSVEAFRARVVETFRPGAVSDPAGPAC